MKIITLNEKFTLEFQIKTKVVERLRSSINISFVEFPAALCGYTTLHCVVTVKQAEFVRQVIKYLKHD